MARRAFLHLGTAKSGTTYLQELWWRHRAALRDQGLLLPGTALRDHFHAAALVKGMDVIIEELTPQERATWSSTDGPRGARLSSSRAANRSSIRG